MFGWFKRKRLIDKDPYGGDDSDWTYYVEKNLITNKPNKLMRISANGTEIYNRKRGWISSNALTSLIISGWINKDDSISEIEAESIIENSF